MHPENYQMSNQSSNHLIPALHCLLSPCFSSQFLQLCLGIGIQTSSPQCIWLIIVYISGFSLSVLLVCGFIFSSIIYLLKNLGHFSCLTVYILDFAESALWCH